MHLLQMAKVSELSVQARRGATFRMYCSCGLWYTGPVEQGSPEWSDAQEDFFVHLAELEDASYPERIIMEQDVEGNYGGTD